MLLLTKSIFIILTMASIVCPPAYGTGESLKSHKIRLPRVLGSKTTGYDEQTLIELMHSAKVNEDVRLHITKLVAKHGYVIDSHIVHTADDYLLTMHRMPPKNITLNTPTVFLMHGLLGSSDDWVVTGPDHALAYYLVDRGYDVWLGNARGNVHSRVHAHLSPTQSAFWDFSFNEIGIYDLPAMIDYVLEATERSGVKYVGHSQGTTSFYVMCSELPEYNGKIEVMVSLSPLAWMKHASHPIARSMPVGQPIDPEFVDRLYSIVGRNELLPSNARLHKVGRQLCGNTSLAEILCGNIPFMVGGFSLLQMNATKFPVILGRNPAGSSVKQIAHYGQEIVSGYFRKFDYGLAENKVKYGSDTPPSYNLSLVSTPVALFYSERDWLASPKDVAKLQRKLNNVVDVYKIPRVRFGHYDYLWGDDAKELVFDRILELFTEF